jgi:S1-C subfamily serine protease
MRKSCSDHILARRTVAGWRLLAILLAAGLVTRIVLDMRRSWNVGRTIPALERDLGFELGTPYLEGKEVMMITRVQPGKPMAQAGAEARDIILGYTDSRDFYQQLDRSRGDSMQMTLARAGREVVVTLTVPFEHARH